MKKLNLGKLSVESFITNKVDNLQTVAGADSGGATGGGTTCPIVPAASTNIHNPDCPGYVTGVSFRLADCWELIEINQTIA